MYYSVETAYNARCRASLLTCRITANAKIDGMTVGSCFRARSERNSMRAFAHASASTRPYGSVSLPRTCIVGLLAVALTLGSSGYAQGVPPKGEAPSAESAGLLDINRATAAELKALPGMGAAYAQRIIEGRPYTAKNQLVTRGVLPQPAYDRMKNKIIAHHMDRPN